MLPTITGTGFRSLVEQFRQDIQGKKLRMTPPTDKILRIAVSLQRSTFVYSLSVLACLTFLAPATSFAKTYRCDGFVQTRPCGQAFTTDKNHRERKAISAIGVKRSIRAQMKRDEAWGQAP